MPLSLLMRGIFYSPYSSYLSIHTVLLCRFACRLTTLLAVWCCQPKREPSLLNFEFHTACFRVSIDTLTLFRKLHSVIGQPILEVGVVSTNMNQQIFFIEVDLCGFLALFQSCFHNGSFLLAFRNTGIFRVFSTALDLGKTSISRWKTF